MVEFMPLAASGFRFAPISLKISSGVMQTPPLGGGLTAGVLGHAYTPVKNVGRALGTTDIQRRPTGPRTLLAEALEEGARERGAPARLLVLEVGVHALPGGHLAHPGRPAVEVGVRVVRATEPQVAEGRGGYRRGAQVLPIGDAQRGAVLAEEIVGLVVEPALVTELEGRLEARRERAEKVGEALGVEAEVGRELEEEGAELRAEPRRRAAERGGDLVGIAQAEHVRDALRGLQREAEAGRRLMRPAGEQLGRGEAAEGVVDLDRAERARVEAEHVARRQ